MISMTSLPEVVSGLFMFSLSLALRATVLLTGALLLSLLMRRSSGSARHTLWSVTVVALLVLPLLPTVVPEMPILPSLGIWRTEAASSESAATAGTLLPPPLVAASFDGEPNVPPVWPALAGQAPTEASTPPTEVVRPETHAVSHIYDGPSNEEALEAAVPPIKLALLLAWLGGGLLTAGALVMGLWRTRRARTAAHLLLERDWQLTLERARRRTGVTRGVELRLGGNTSTPMTGGLRHPMVLLPESAREWSQETRDLVLAHELVHIKRHDAARQLLGRLALSLHWFNPLAWVATRASVLAREQACDEAVVALGHRPSSYARHLLELAEPVSLPIPALSMLERPHLEKRLMAILRPTSRTRPWTVLVTALSAVVWAVTVAAASPSKVISPEDVAAISGSVSEVQPAPISNEVSPAEVDSPPATDGLALERSVQMGSPKVILPPAPARMTSAIRPISETPALVNSPVVLENVTVTKPPSEECWTRGVHGNFSGTLSVSSGNRDGRRVERFGYLNSDRIIETSIEDQALCLRAHGPVTLNDDGTRIESIGGGGWLVIASRTENRSFRLEVLPGESGFDYRWTVDGFPSEFGETEAEWRDAMLAVLGGYWQVGRIRGDVSSLRGEISSIRGQRSSLRGQISSIRGHVSSLKGRISSIRGHRSSLLGRISSVRGHESSLRGKISSVRGHRSSLLGRISSIRGHESSLRGRISSLRGRIAQLESARRVTEDDETKARLESEIGRVRASIAEVENEIRIYDKTARVAEVEREIAEYDAEDRVLEIEAEIEEYDAEGRIREIQDEIDAYDAVDRVLEVEAEIEAYDAEERIRRVEAEIERLDVDRRVSAIEARIEALDADRRVREIRERLEADVERLRELTSRLTRVTLDVVN